MVMLLFFHLSFLLNRRCPRRKYRALYAIVSQLVERPKSVVRRRFESGQWQTWLLAGSGNISRLNVFAPKATELTPGKDPGMRQTSIDGDAIAL